VRVFILGKFFLVAVITPFTSWVIVLINVVALPLAVGSLTAAYLVLYPLKLWCAVRTSIPLLYNFVAYKTPFKFNLSVLVGFELEVSKLNLLC
jgi:hypothetical protein